MQLEFGQEATSGHLFWIQISVPMFSDHFDVFLFNQLISFTSLFGNCGNNKGYPVGEIIWLSFPPHTHTTPRCSFVCVCVCACF